MHIVSARYLRTVSVKANVRKVYRNSWRYLTLVSCAAIAPINLNFGASTGLPRVLETWVEEKRLQNACTQAYRRSRRTSWVASGLCIDCAMRSLTESMKMGFMSQRGTEMRGYMRQRGTEMRGSTSQKGTETRGYRSQHSL